MFKEYTGDMFKLFFHPRSLEVKADAIVITTNATVTTRDGKGLPADCYGVMGKGCAKQAATI